MPHSKGLSNNPNKSNSSIATYFFKIYSNILWFALALPEGLFPADLPTYLLYGTRALEEF
jgi:hypothetical protein